MELAMEEASAGSEGLRLKLTDFCEPWAEVLAAIFCLLATPDGASPGNTTDLFTAPFGGTLTPWWPKLLSTASGFSAAWPVGIGLDSIRWCCVIMVASELMREGRKDGSIETRLGFSTTPRCAVSGSLSEPNSSSEPDSIPDEDDSLVPGLAMSICRFLRARGTDDFGES